MPAGGGWGEDDRGRKEGPEGRREEAEAQVGWERKEVGQVRVGLEKSSGGRESKGTGERHQGKGKPAAPVALRLLPHFWPHSHPISTPGVSGGLTSAGSLWRVGSGPVEALQAGADRGCRVRGVAAGRAW